MPTKKTKSYNFPDPIANDALIGHAAAAKSFIDAFGKRDEYPVHPVWILSGTRGIGKSTLAYHIARYVFKESLELRVESLDLFGDTGQNSQPSTLSSQLSFPVPADDPVFQKMLSGGYGDLFIIDIPRNIDERGNPKPDAKAISVHTVRAMIEKMHMTSMEGAWRVIIIDSIDELSKSAANAMLKLLEEPPAQTLFLLVSHSLANALPTIRSRARIEKLQPLSNSDLRELFYKFLPDEEITPALIKLASGSFGRIADLKKNGGDELYADLLAVCDPSAPGGAAEVMEVAVKIAKEPTLHGLVLDAAAHFGLSDLYSEVTREIANITGLYLEAEIAIFNLIIKIKSRR
ncbi:MAG: AAA family ATPase [Alphaproteobacteria bacterium]|nr:AAA family ATPase [Alphaproteobacteria bacterium]